MGDETATVFVSVAVHSPCVLQDTVVGRILVSVCTTLEVDTISFPTVEEGFRVAEGVRIVE